MSWTRPSEAERRREREENRAANNRALATSSRSMHRGTYAGSTSGDPAPKSEPYRDPVLLEMARGRPCLLMVPAVCSHRIDTVVAAHSNLPEHGKAMARKSDDVYSCWADACCHLWLDQGKARAADKEAAFMAAHARQVMYWRLIATDPNEPERFRRAARRALERLNATPLSTEQP